MDKLSDGEINAIENSLQSLQNTNFGSKINQIIDLANTIGTDNGKAKSDGSDASSDYLETKIVEGDNIAINKMTDMSGNKSLEISGEGKSKVASGDSEANFLGIKIVAGAGITITELTDGLGKKTLEISLT